MTRDDTDAFLSMFFSIVVTVGFAALAIVGVDRFLTYVPVADMGEPMSLEVEETLGDAGMEFEVTMGEPVITTVRFVSKHLDPPLPARGGCLVDDDCRKGTCVGRLCQEFAYGFPGGGQSP